MMVAVIFIWKRVIQSLLQGTLRPVVMDFACITRDGLGVGQEPYLLL